ncbi:MAG: DegV family protein [Christensenellaceae bacterium]|nr:DegV family protein [Christensenellaceae bacterium]
MVKISCDSTADLLNEVYGTNLYEAKNVTVVPLYVRVGDNEYADGVDITMRQLLKLCDETGLLPKTSAPEVDRLMHIFQELTSDGSEVVFLTISSEFSAAYNNAVLAANAVKNVYVVDSRNLSSGFGHIVMEACDLAEKGLAAAEIKRVLDEEIVPKVEASFVLDRLDYMVKGGRCSAVAALGANLLQLHPSIEVIDGSMKVVKKYRGSWERCLKNYVKDRLYGRDDIRFHRIFITYTETPEEIVEEVSELVSEYADFVDVIKTTAGCTVASHCGARTLGVLFIRK